VVVQVTIQHQRYPMVVSYSRTSWHPGHDRRPP
jgi:hypothetical protein